MTTETHELDLILQETDRQVEEALEHLPVLLTDREGNVADIFYSVQDCATKMGVTPEVVTGLINGEGTLNGLFVSFGNPEYQREPNVVLMGSGIEDIVDESNFAYGVD